MEEVDALKVGQMFVMQYYTQMHRDAQQMVRFYVENSTIVRGGFESGPAEVITGSKVCEALPIWAVVLQDFHLERFFSLVV